MISRIPVFPTKVNMFLIIKKWDWKEVLLMVWEYDKNLESYLPQAKGWNQAS